LRMIQPPKDSLAPQSMVGCRGAVCGRAWSLPASHQEENMYLNWEALSYFDPNSPNPFATHGIPLANYGNYGGANYSAGEIGGHITGTSADPPPVDPLDALFYQHDLVYQTSTNPFVRAAADVQL